MTYIILAAGKGTKLQPLTFKHPKSLYKLDENTSVLQHCIRTIKQYDKKAEIVVVLGFMSENIKREVIPENVRIVFNPFYSVTGSMGSLWFAKQYLQRENVTIINGDVLMSNELMNDIVCQHTDVPFVLLDSKRSSDNKYTVQTQGDKVCVMSKNLTNFFGTYASVAKLDAVTSRFLLEELEEMVNNEMYTLFFEDALVQMIFEKDFDLYFKDIKDYQWTEVDGVDDLLKAKEIYKNYKKEK